MKPPLPNILTDEHCDCLDRILQSCAITGDCIERLKAAGVPIGKAEAENNMQRNIAAALKQQFRPDRS